MATRIVSWRTDEHIVSPSLSKTPSIVSVDSIIPDKPESSPSVEGVPREAEPRAAGKYMASQVIEPSGIRKWASASMFPGADAADGSFIHHHKYFFNDGNVTFLVDNTLYCVHRYFFSRDSFYFSTRFAQLDIRDHEAFPTIISLGDIERKDFDAFLSVLYPENFEENDLSYDEWKSVLHLSTRWGFASIRKRALSSIKPPTPHDRLLLARTYSVDDWVVPALSALCERMTPLTLSEARQMDIEDVVLVSTVREDIRSLTLQVDAAEIPRRIEAVQAGKLVGLGSRFTDVPPVFPTNEISAPVNPKGTTKEDTARESDDKRPAKGEATGNTSMRIGEPTQPMKISRGEVTAMRNTVETGAGAWMSRVTQPAKVVARHETERGIAAGWRGSGKPLNGWPSR